jgi:lipopolysaccharide/colanic/teichoic acid biosynthesis glycosyltransferase
MVGGGVEAHSLQQSASDRGLGNVEFTQRRPVSEIGEILTLSDALLVHLRDDPLFSITIPSKTQAYMMAGRPILMGVRGDAATIVVNAGVGIAFEPENAAMLAASVRRLISIGPEERYKMGEAGRTYYWKNLSLEVGSSRFADVLRAASHLKPHVLAAKRLADVGASLTALVLLSVPMSVVAVLVKQRLGSPVLFKQVRPGINGTPFEMLKFRTMTDHRDARGQLLQDRHRLTAFGSFLRATSIDELPALWNVLVGQMSLVGPRPLLMRYTEYFTKEERLRLTVKPGITGWAQVEGRNAASWDTRLALDVRYVRNLSVGRDVRILFLTLARVFRRQGVVVDPESTMLNFDEERRQAGASR